MAKRKSSKRSQKKKVRSQRGSTPMPNELRQVNLHAAGIDVGSNEHWVAVPTNHGQSVRCFGTFTEDLVALADWLVECDIETVALESTGIYWITLFEVLEGRGLHVRLVDTRKLKYVPGRKSDVMDCQWLQQLHTYGLLEGAFRPADEICVLRGYVRQRCMLVESLSREILHMQKAMEQMNVKLTEVLSDVTGVTGMQIIRAILEGERDAKELAKFRNHRCKHDEATIAKALRGNWRKEHLFQLRQAVQLYDFLTTQVGECDTQIEAYLKSFETKADSSTLKESRGKARRSRQGNAPAFDLRQHLYAITGTDLTQIDGIEAYTVLRLISEIGLDMTRWPSVKHFVSWLGLCPGTKRSGGKQLSSKSKRSANRAAAVLRMAAQTLYRSRSALGAFYRRIKARIGAAEAVTATAHKLARLLYTMLRYRKEFVDIGEDGYLQMFKERIIRNMKRKALDCGYKLVPIADLPNPPAPSPGG